MTLKEASKKFNFPADILKKYVSYGFIKSTHPDEYTEEDFSHLGLIKMMMDAGFTAEETKQYLTLTKKPGTDAEQIRMLKKRRRSLLDDIHKKQQLLDHLDFMIWKKNRRQTQ